MKPYHRWLVLLGLLVTSGRLLAAELGDETEPMSMELHGFASQGFIFSTNNNYLAKSKEGSFEFSEAGINFTKPLRDNLRMGMQLFARKVGPLGNFTPRFDWFYVDYRARDWFGIRAGRVKLPFGLYNDTSDIDAARVPVLLPQSIYPIQNRDFLLAQTGVELYGYLDLKRVGALNYNAYGGTIQVDTNNTPGAAYDVQSFNVPYVVGGRLLWETPLDGLRVGSSLQYLRVDGSAVYHLTPPATVGFRVPAVLWVNSAEYSHRDLVLSAEYSRWYVKTESTNGALIPLTPFVISERAYLLATYRLKSWLHPGAYYSLLLPNIADRSGRANVQHDLAGTLRFDINPYWLVKLEGHYMAGTAALSSPLNNNTPLSELSTHWTVFLVKMTGYF